MLPILCRPVDEAKVASRVINRASLAGLKLCARHTLNGV